MNNLHAWSKITDNLYIWHYNTSFANYLTPMPDLDELSADIPMYKRNGVKGLFAEGNYSPGGGGFMDELKAYLIAKLLWDSSADPKAVIADFVNGYFGKAGKPIGQWLDLMHNKVRTERIHGYIWEGPDAAFLSDDVMAKSDQLFDEAERIADGPEVLGRVKHARLSLEFVKVARQANKAASGTPEEKASALANLEAFIQECKADGITNLDEGSNIDQRFEAYAKGLR